MDGNQYSGFEIAVIGMSGRFPGAATLEQFWENLNNGVESIRFFSLTELAELGRDSSTLSSPNFVPAHGVLDDFDLFDSDYFGFSPWEADVLDPQHRIFLECASAALENSGYDPQKYSGLIGVFAGASVDNYLYRHVLTSNRISNPIQHYQANYLNQVDFLTSRVSYKLGLRGPSFTIQSACSTSLIAVHQACQQLLSGSCDMALAGGVSLTLPENWGYLYEEGMIMSPDGHCRAFDEEAKGVLKGDGVGVVVLKRLADALDDGDEIDAVILGSASNNDGDVKVGYSAPGINGQIDVIRAAMMMADVNADTIDYVEAHGTGTPVGDPIEISALTQVYQEETSRTNFCGIGSVKSNIGHLDAAAGIAGFIKTVLSVKNRTLPATVNFNRTNPKIDFKNSPFYVNDRSKSWQSQNGPRRAGVSSFGIGGSNAHVIIEEAPEISPRTNDQPGYRIFPVSAKDEDALARLSENLKNYIVAYPELCLADIAHTLQGGRQYNKWRRILIADSRDMLISAFDTVDSVSPTGQAMAAVDKVVFLFSGQGSQYLHMGRDLYETEPEFRADIDSCAEILKSFLGVDIREIVYPVKERPKDQLTEELQQTANAQPAIFVIEYAMARHWIRRGVVPDTVIGHSLGELCAACLAGIFSLEDALELVAVRGRAMQQMAPGVMSAVPLSEDSISAYLDSQVSLAAVNTPSLCVISGPESAVAAVEARIVVEHNVEVQRLHTSHAFHSEMMASAEKPFHEVLSRCQKNPPRLEIISTVTGAVLGDGEVQENDYWLRNFRSTVRFADAVGKLQQPSLFIEVGPGKTLVNLAKKQEKKPGFCRYVSSLRHPNLSTNDRQFWYLSFGKVWLAGKSVRWEVLSDAEPRNRIHLPGYPFKRKRHWIEPGTVSSVQVAYKDRNKRQDLEDWFYMPTWQRVAKPVASRPQRKYSWIVFKDSGEIASQLGFRLRGAGNTIIEVESGSRYERNANHFRLRPDSSEDFVEMIKALEAEGNLPDRIIHCGLADSDGKPTDNFWALFFLVRALQYCGVDLTISLIAIATQSQVVLGNENIEPAKNTILGLLRVLPAEMPWVSTRYIDLQLEHTGQSLSDRDLELLYLDIVADVGSGFLLAIRNGFLWKNCLEKIEVPPVETDPRYLKQEGTYLITGGLGGVGLLIAEFLAEKTKANLVLVGRDAGALSTYSEEKLEQIARNANGLQLVSADVVDPVAMEKVFKQAVSKFGSLDGVFHAAGIPGGGIIANQNRSRIEEVWNSKTKGADVICRFANDFAADFVVLFSSLTSFVGFPGRLDYTAANLYLDAVAQKASVVGRMPVFSINWDTWNGVGMAASDESQAGEITDRIEPEDGIEILRRILDQREPQIIVSTRLLTDVTGQPDDTRHDLTESDDTAVFESAEFEQAVVKVGHSKDSVESTLCRIWQELLGLDTVSVTDNFFELGGDSVVSIQFVSRARQEGINLTSKQIFDHQTIAELAQAATLSGAFPGVDPEDKSGSFPLSPVQSWFFQQDFVNPDRWNLARWVSLPEDVDEKLLSEAAHAVVQRYGILRVRFVNDDGNWQQEVTSELDPELFKVILVDGSDEPELQANLDARAISVQADLSLDTGILVRFALFRSQKEPSVRLFVAVHHLVIDLLSLNFIIEDLRTAYNKLSSGEAISLPEETASFRKWSETLTSYMSTPQSDAVVKYWLEFASRHIEPITRNYPAEENTVAKSAYCNRILDRSETTTLIKRVATALTAQLQDVLLAALALGLQRWSGNETVCIDVEGHGRDGLDVNLDVSRSIGWFTSIYPLLVQVPADTTVKDCLKQVQAVRSSLPASGLGYGLVRYLHPDYQFRNVLETGPRAEIVFLFQGQIPRSKHADSPWQFYPGMAAGMRDAKQQRTHLIEVNVYVTETLNIEIGYCTGIHEASSINALADQYLEALRQFCTMARDLESAAGNARELDLSLLDLSESDKAELVNLITRHSSD